MVWHSDDQDGDEWGIYSQRFDALGNAIGLETRVNDTTVYSQQNPTVIALDGDVAELVAGRRQRGAGLLLHDPRKPRPGRRAGL